MRKALITLLASLLAAGTVHADPALDIVIFDATGKIGSFIDEAEQAKYPRQRNSVAY